MKFEHYGAGIVKGMAVTMKNLLRRPITTQYPEERLTVSRRIRGNELVWSQEKCTGCYTCARSCPHGVITIETPENGSKGIVPAPCTQTCPANVDAARYVRLIAEGKFAESLAVVREKIPCPSGCGFICAHPCETKCTRGQLDEPIAIRLWRALAWGQEDGLWNQKSRGATPTGKRAAIIGAGPAGRTAGYYLAKLGHSVTIFEALPEAGGMMRYGIPEYRLPKAILRAEIKEMTDIGVEIKTNTSVDSLESLLQQGYHAIFIGVGAQQATGIGVDGEDDPRVLGGVYFLRDVNLGRKVDVGNRVAVIGGGNTAMDSARTARRLGAEEVTIVYRRTRAEMPASAEEIEEALHEGIKIYFLAAPSRVISQDGEVQLECIRMKLGAPDDSGRRRPEPIKGSEFTRGFDTILAAFGQRAVELELPGQLRHKFTIHAPFIIVRVQLIQPIGHRARNEHTRGRFTLAKETALLKRLVPVLVPHVPVASRRRHRAHHQYRRRACASSNTQAHYSSTSDTSSGFGSSPSRNCRVESASYFLSFTSIHRKNRSLVARSKFLALNTG